MTYEERLFRMRGYHCDPTSLMVAELVVSVAGATASIEGQQAQAKAQEQTQANLTKANNDIAVDQTSQLRIQESQDAESRAREIEKARQASQKAKASARVAAGQAGVSGNSVDALLNEYDASFGQFKEATNRQGTLNSEATGTQIEAIRSGAKYQNLTINAPIVGPNYAAAAVGVAKDSIGAYQAYNPNAFQRGTKK